MSPFPAAELKTVLSQYKNVKEYVWSQEEHRNMGAWSFVSPRFENILGIKLKYTGREVASCISGISSLHVKQVKEILSKPFDKFWNFFKKFKIIDNLFNLFNSNKIYN